MGTPREETVGYGDAEMRERKKRVRYHMARRANLEVEALLMHFWEIEGERLTVEDVEALEKLLEIDDLDLLEMLLGKRTSPFQELQGIVAKIRRAWDERLTR